MKRTVVFIALVLILLNGCTKNPQATDERAGQTGILMKTSDVSYISTHDNEEHISTVEKGALVLILDENEDYYHIQLAVTELPAFSGYVEKDAVSFNDADIQNATSGLVKNVNVYESPEHGARIKDEEYSSAILIAGEDGDYFECALPGGDSGWIKKEDIQYIVEKSNWTVEKLQQEDPE